MKDREIHNLISCSNLKELRISKYPIKSEINLVVEDRLEDEGNLKLYEYLGGTLYVNAENAKMENIVLIAELEVAKSDEGELLIKKFFCEYGYDELASELLDQAIYFAKFYGLNLKL